mmetsp:Transcript_33433/g.70272  ORF Transcript_33433/g.70272 Transcript_33433/m.70272 type:complete len:404 (-) Transcript_33433:316-1527(-)
MACCLGLVIIVNMENRIRNTSILRLCRIKVIRHELVSLILQRHILQHGILMDRPVNIRLGLLRKIDGLGITPTLKVEDAILVPSVLVIPNERTMRIRRKRRLAGTTQSEEEGRVTLLPNIGGAMHGKLRRILHGKPVIHQGKDAFLVLAAVPRAEDDGALLLHVEDHGHLRVEAVPLPILVDQRTRVDHGKVRLEPLQLRLLIRANEHVGHEMLLPRHLVDEADFSLALFVGAAESVEDVALFLGVEVIDGLLVQLVEDLRGRGLVDLPPVDVGVALAADVLDEPLVAGRSAGELAGVDGEGVAVFGVGDASLVVADLVLEELLEGLILVDGRGGGDAEGGYAGLVARGGAGVDGGGVVSAADGVLVEGEGRFVCHLLILLQVIFCRAGYLLLCRFLSGRKGR